MEFEGLKAAKIDKHGPLYKVSDLYVVIKNQIHNETYFQKMVKTMTSDTEKAIAKTEEVTENFSIAINRFFEMQKSFAEQSKKVSGNIRDAEEKLAQGLAKIEKAANFQRLEHYVDLLERAANAMNSLAELEKDGKLEKISAAIR